MPEIDVSTPEFATSTLTSPTSAALAVHSRAADGEARAIVHINHGLAEHGARYAPFAAALNARGYHAIAHDHRGHGLTEAPDGAPRRFADTDGWTKLLDDVQAVQDHARSQWGDLPVVTFGHSMGSVIAFNHVLRRPDQVAAAACWNGNMAIGGLKGVMRLILWFEALAGGPYTPSHTLDKMTFKAWNKRFPEQRSDADWLSRDLAEVDKYNEDPLCGWPSSVSLWRDFLNGVAFAEDDANLASVPKDLPIHLIGGSKDPATNGGKTVQHLHRRLKRAKFSRVQCEVLKDFRHETLNEIGREDQMTRFINWLDEALA